MKTIELTQGFVAMVDDADFEWLNGYKWHTNRASKSSRIYAARNIRIGPERRRSTTNMHRVILGITDRKIDIDHIDGNGLNNQRSNLRTSTHAQNLQNSGLRKTNKTGYQGVSVKSDCRQRWQAHIKAGDKRVYLGLFDCPVKAARAYDAKARELHGEFANLNFPE
jgi:hypothetical protein